MDIKIKYKDTFIIILIDKEDYKLIKDKHISYESATGYAKIELSNSIMSLHRYLLGLSVGDKKYVDHKNGNKLDNRKDNLRVCTAADNAHNLRCLSKHNSSGFKGVCFDRSTNKWRAKVQYLGKAINSKRFDTAIEAAKEYDRLSKLYFGEFACTNKDLGLLKE